MSDDDVNDELEQLREQVHDETAVAVAQATNRSLRRWVPWVVAGAVLVSLLVSSAVAVAVVGLYGRQADTAAAVTEVRRLAEQGYTLGETANAELSRRGQQTVPIPEPGTRDDGEVLVAAATARVLASLPDNRPTAAEIGAAVAQYVAANQSRFGPSPQQISAAVAAHLEENPPPSGPPGEPGQDGEPGAKGEKGDKGDPPTQQEIQAAFDAYIRDNPNALCPRGGSFAQLRVQLADGGTADTWTCVVQVLPPSSTTPTPAPLLPPLGR